MQRIFHFGFLLFAAMVAYGSGKPEYSVERIPAPLKADASMVIRDYTTTFEILGPSKTRERVHKVITLLNVKASDMAGLAVWYNSTSTVSDPDFHIFDETGADITRQFRDLGIRDESATPEGTLYSDYRVKTVSPVIAHYPVTIEYSYEVTRSAVAFYPYWNPVSDEHVALQQADFLLVFPESLRPRYRMLNGLANPVETGNGKQIRLAFGVHDLAALSDEPFSPPMEELTPCLMLAPQQINLKEYEGAFETWNDLGRFIGALIRGRDRLPEATVTALRDLARDCPDQLTRVRTIYHYMQTHTRYVGVQVGIGGWQPVAADYVDRKGYGDCKGLVNYTRAMLSAVGIASSYCLVNAGSGGKPCRETFPDNQFNHIILLVPVGKDSVWLECTSQTIPFGFLGSSTTGHPALVVTDTGGTLVRTPDYTTSENTSIRTGNLRLDTAGSAAVVMKTVNRGLCSEDFEGEIQESPADQHNHFTARMGLTLAGIDHLSYRQTGEIIPEKSEEASFTVPLFASLGGRRYHIPCVFSDRKVVVPRADGHRSCDVVIRNAFTDTDTVRITVPEGLTAEFIPPVQVIDSPYGNYRFEALLDNGVITVTRRLSFHKGRYEPSAYEAFVTFLSKIRKCDSNKMVLVKGH